MENKVEEVAHKVEQNYKDIQWEGNDEKTRAFVQDVQYSNYKICIKEKRKLSLKQCKEVP